MRMVLTNVVLLCLLGVRLSGQPTDLPPLQDQLAIWLNPGAATQSRLDAFAALTKRNEFQGVSLQSYAVNPKAVTDSLVFSFEHGQSGHQCFALMLAVWVQDRACYSTMIEPALRSSDREVRGFAMGAAEFFNDRSEVVVSALLAELRTTNLLSNLQKACLISAKLEVKEAIEPMADLVANSSLGRARGAAEALAHYPSLPAHILARMEVARTRFERAQSEANKRPQTPTQEWLEKQRLSNGTPSEVELLLKALDKVKEKAQLPPPADAKHPETTKATKKAGKSSVDWKTAPSGSQIAEKDSTAPTTKSGETSRNSLLVFLGLVSLGVIAWFLLKGRLH